MKYLNMSNDEGQPEKFVCEDCDREFETERGLKIHARVHKEDIPERDHLINDVRVRLEEVREQFRPFRGRIRGLVEQAIEHNLATYSPENRIQVMQARELPEERAEEIEKRQKLIETIVKKLEAEINAVAAEIIRGGLKDGLFILSSDELEELVKREDLRIRRGRPGRQRDCVYLEHGDGLKEQVVGLQLPL